MIGIVESNLQGHRHHNVQLGRRRWGVEYRIFKDTTGEIRSPMHTWNDQLAMWPEIKPTTMEDTLRLLTSKVFLKSSKNISTPSPSQKIVFNSLGVCFTQEAGLSIVSIAFLIMRRSFLHMIEVRLIGTPLMSLSWPARRQKRGKRESSETGIWQGLIWIKSINYYSINKLEWTPEFPNIWFFLISVGTHNEPNAIDLNVSG